MIKYTDCGCFPSECLNFTWEELLLGGYLQLEHLNLKKRENG